MPTIGERITIDAVDDGIKITVLNSSIVLNPKEARNLNKILVNLIPRIREIQKDKINNQISELETKIIEYKKKIETLDKLARSEEKEDKDIRIG